MKKLMMLGCAALSCAVLAQEPEGPKNGPAKDRGRRPSMMSERQMPMGGMGAGMAGDPAVMAVMNPAVAEKIGLSDETQLKIKQLDLDSRKALRELQQKTRAAMDKQAKLLKEPKIDEAAVMAAIDELFDLRKEMAKSQTKRMIAIKSLLTPEQLEKATEAMKSVREERRMKRDNGPKAQRGPNGKRGPGDADGKAKDDQPPPPPPAE